MAARIVSLLVASAALASGFVAYRGAVSDSPVYDLHAARRTPRLRHAVRSSPQAKVCV